MQDSSSGRPAQALHIMEVLIMEHIRLQLIPIEEMNKDLYCQDGMHSNYFREFVQMMLCHAWSIGFLPSELWDAIPDIAQAATMHDIGKTALYFFPGLISGPKPLHIKMGVPYAMNGWFAFGRTGVCQSTYHSGLCHGGDRTGGNEGRSDL